MAALVAIAIKRVMRSEKVANVMFQVSFCFMICAATGGQWGAILLGMAATAATGKHLDNVEREKLMRL
jgi:hypothetical protein